MKRILFGGFLSLTGSLWALGIIFIAGNNLTSGWSTPPGRFLTTVGEMNLGFAFALSCLCVVAGIVVMALGFVRKKK